MRINVWLSRNVHVLSLSNPPAHEKRWTPEIGATVTIIESERECGKEVRYVRETYFDSYFQVFHQLKSSHVNNQSSAVLLCLLDMNI